MDTREKRKKLALFIIGIVSACIVVFLCLQNLKAVRDAASRLSGLVLPLLLGCGFALVLNVPMRFFEALLWKNAKKKWLMNLRRPAAFLISLILILGILAGIIWLVIPEVIGAVTVVVQAIIERVQALSGMTPEQVSQLPFGEWILNADWNGLLQHLQTWVQNQGGNIVNTAVGTISTVVSGVFNVFISFIFSVYILFSKDTLKQQAARLVRAWLPQRFGEGVIHVSAVANRVFRNFISGQTTEAAILGTLCMVGMFILRLPYAPMIGALIFVTAFIPIVGAFIGVGVGAFMIVTIDPIKAIVFVVFFLVLQQLEGNLIYPRVMGSKVHLPGLWVLVAVTVGGGIGGPLGMLLSIPVASTVYTLVKEATLSREKKLAQISEE